MKKGKMKNEKKESAYHANHRYIKNTCRYVRYVETKIIEN